VSFQVNYLCTEALNGFAYLCHLLFQINIFFHLYTSCTVCCDLVVFCASSSHSSMSLPYFACGTSLSAVTLANSIEVDYARNWISCVTLVCKLCSTFTGNCDNTKSMWLNACAHSCIYVVGNSMASDNIFMIHLSTNVDNG
jgi:hypothetical protein